MSEMLAVDDNVKDGCVVGKWNREGCSGNITRIETNRYSVCAEGLVNGKNLNFPLIGFAIEGMEKAYKCKMELF